MGCEGRAKAKDSFRSFHVTDLLAGVPADSCRRLSGQHIYFAVYDVHISENQIFGGRSHRPLCADLSSDLSVWNRRCGWDFTGNLCRFVRAAMSGRISDLQKGGSEIEN